MRVSEWLRTLADGRERERRLGEAFQRRFGDREVHLWRAPGRVNLIGEHTDYNNLPVLPMAIPYDIWILFGPRVDGRVTLENTVPDFENRTFNLEQSIPPFDAGDWGNYAKAAVHGILLHSGWDSRRWVGFDAVVDGNVPQAAGLSSSSALVVACGLAFAEANQIEMPRDTLADLMADAERYVGTRGGGMDQAVCLLASEGSALLIHFFPLRVEAVPVPNEAAFVVCHSLVQAPKSREARAAYNLRALECRLAAGILARQINTLGKYEESLPRLGDLISGDSGHSASDLLGTLEDLCGQKAWTPGNIAGFIGVSRESLDQDWFQPYGVEPDDGTPLRILECARHVLTERDRVLEAGEALRRGDLECLGGLMNASHRSCARDFRISTPELDWLVEVARRHGALGARLTGAGFGGCTVSLVPAGEVDTFCEGVEKDYYSAGLSQKQRDFIDSLGLSGPPIYPCHPVGGASQIM